MPLRARVRGSLIAAYLSPRAAAMRRRLRSGSLRVYLEPGDPYAYLLAQALPTLLARHGARAEVVAIGPPGGDVDPAPEARRRYAVRDARLLAQFYAVAFPAGDDTPADPALARRAGAVLLARPSLETAATVGAALWARDEVAMTAAERSLGSATGDIDAALAAGYADVRRRGHYQSATIERAGEWMWGLDRLAVLDARLGGDGTGAPLRPAADWPALALAPGAPLEAFVSFRSPYSYLALERTIALAARHRLELRLRPVLPMVMRGLPVPRQKRMNLARDAAREAHRLGIPFGRLCDPLGAGVERCLAVFPAAERAGRAADFALSAGRGIWSEARDLTTDTDLRAVLERAGMAWADAAAALADPAEGLARAEENRADLLALGLWGVPSFRAGDLAVWGQDRLWMLDALLGARP